MQKYLVVGNDELDGILGRTIKCPHCSKKHIVESFSSERGTMTMQSYQCGKRSYFCGINGESILHFKGLNFCKCLPCKKKKKCNSK
jgi:hypothetical protein